MGPTWGPSGATRTQVGPMLATQTLLSEDCTKIQSYNFGKHKNITIHITDGDPEVLKYQCFLLLHILFYKQNKYIIA